MQTGFSQITVDSSESRTKLSHSDRYNYSPAIRATVGVEFFHIASQSDEEIAEGVESDQDAESEKLMKKQ